MESEDFGYVRRRRRRSVSHDPYREPSLSDPQRARVLLGAGVMFLAATLILVGMTGGVQGGIGTLPASASLDGSRVQVSNNGNRVWRDVAVRTFAGGGGESESLSFVQPGESRSCAVRSGGAPSVVLVTGQAEGQPIRGFWLGFP